MKTLKKSLYKSKNARLKLGLYIPSYKHYTESALSDFFFLFHIIHIQIGKNDRKKVREGDSNTWYRQNVVDPKKKIGHSLFF